MAGVDAKGKQAAQSLDRSAASASSAARKIKQSNSIIKESVESMSSEIIESFGVDGDVANMLANEMVKLKVSTLVAGGAIAGLVVGVGVLTVAMAGSAAEIRTVSQLTGLSTDQVQKYQTAATAAGVATDVFTNAIRELKDRAKEATKGNTEIAQSFQALGVNASDAARNAAPAFEKLLDVLETVPDAQTRITIAQRVLGDVNDSTLAGILALTDAHGALRDRVNEVSVALDKQSVDELAQLDRDWDLFKANLDVFAKKVGLGTVNTLEWIGLALAGETDKMNQAGSATGSFSQQQGQAAAATNATTGAIQNQTGAIAGLTAELANVRISTANNAVSAEIAKIAVYAKNTKEAIAIFKLASENPELAKSIADQKRFAENQKALNDLINPPSKPRGGGRAKSAAVSELDQLKKQLADVSRDISVFGNLTSQEFRLRMQLEGAREFKSQLDEILKLRRSLGEPVAVAFPATGVAAQREIERLNALKTAHELLAKQDIGAPIRAKAEADAAAMRSVLESFDDVQKELRAMSGDEVENVGAELGERFAEAMANAIKAGRGDIVDAINKITEEAKQRARNARDTRRAQDATSIAGSELEQKRAAIQNDLNRGIITEIQARERQIQIEQQARAGILAMLEEERRLAVARGDSAEAARIATEIEKTKGLGEGVNTRLQAFKDQLGQGFDDIIGALATGAARWQDAARSLATNFFDTLATEFMLAATGGKYGSLGEMLGGMIGDKLGGVFGNKMPGATATTPPFNPNAGSVADKIKDGLKDNAKTVSDSITGAAKGTTDAVTKTGNQSIAELIRQNQISADMANCACAAPKGPSLLGSILGAVVGAVGAGFMGGGGGDGESGSGYSGAPAGGYFEGSHGVKMRLRASGGSVSAGMPYLWNEPGAKGELLVPAGNGYILNRRDAMRAVGEAAGQGNQGTVNNISININVSAPTGTVTPQTRAQIATQTAQALNAALVRNG